MSKVRLDKYVATAKTLTRSEAHALIKRGRVQVDGRIIIDVGFKIDTDSAVHVDGKETSFSEYHYYMLNKPDGFICSTEDMRDPTIMELLPENVKKQNVFPVGRLDKDTLGLVILTDNGKLAHFLLSPKRHVDKRYYLKSDLPMTESDVEAVSRGIDIGEKQPTLPAKLEILEDGISAYITLHEGKFHQIKRMLSALGKTVIYLERVSFDQIELDPTLKRGETRPLLADEIDSLLKNMV